MTSSLPRVLISEMQRGNLTILQAEVMNIDAPAKLVTLDDGEALPFDHLIVAAGATHSYFGNHAWVRHAPGLKTLADAFEIRARGRPPRYCGDRGARVTAVPGPAQES